MTIDDNIGTEETTEIPVCRHYTCAVEQREVENKQGLGNRGTMSFERMGCYDCYGLNKDCLSYTVKVIK